MMSKVRVKIGDKLGKLTVKERKGSSKYGEAMWLCECECGNEIISLAKYNGKNTSCGSCPEKIIKYGLLTTTGRYEVRYTGKKRIKARRFLECVCDCGNIVWVDKSSLKRWGSNSCGCLNKKILSDRSIDLVGYKFNNCEVLRKTENVVHGGISKVAWVCSCHCGNEFIATTEHIRSGNIKSCGCKHWPRGEESPNYIGGRPEDKTIRSSAEYNDWRMEVFKRNNFVCKCCENKNIKLNAHHIKSFTRFPELRLDVDNGMCLCEECHTEFHNLYGRKSFTSDDLYEFLKEKRV